MCDCVCVWLCVCVCVCMWLCVCVYGIVCVLLYLYEHIFAGEFAFFPTKILPFAFVDQFWERWKILGTAWTERLAWWLASEVLRSTAAHCSWFTAAWAQPAITSTTYHEAYNVYHTTPCTSNQTQVHKIYPLLINHPDLLCPRWPQPSMMCQRTSHTLPLLGSSTPLCRSGNLTRHVMPYDGTYLLYIVQGLIWDQPKLCPYLDTEPKALSRINASLYLPKLFVYINTTVPSNSQHRDKNHHRSCYERGAASLLICSKRVCFRKEILSHALFMTNILM